MALPGLEWLKRQLAKTDIASGGWEAKMKHPVMGGAGFAMSVMFVLIWLLALAPLCLWASARWVVAKKRRRSAHPPAP